MKLRIFLTIFCLCCVAFAEPRKKHVNIPGFKPIACAGERTLSCRHVPYAEYPFRFEPAKPIAPWTNYTYEDYFLTLDIFTKKLNEAKPVIVALLQSNLGEFDYVEIPRIFLKRVVVVSVKYRAGLYGFLSTNTKQIRGNEALFDIITALNWVQNYIPYFGGNPDNVTLMGLEDSGALVHTLALSPNTPKGLFNQVIIGETTANTPRLVTKNPLKYVTEVASRVGCSNTDTTTELNRCLLNPRINLGRVMRTCAFKEFKGTNFSPLKLVVGDQDGLLPEFPGALARRSGTHYPALIGTSLNIKQRVLEDLIDDEDFLNFSPLVESILDDAVDIVVKFADQDLSERWIDFVRDQVVNMSEHHYSNQRIYKTVLQDLIGILDSKFPILRAAKLNSPTYLYTFNYDLFTLNPNQLGFMDLEKYAGGSVENKAFRTLINIWSKFAETGKPPSTIPNVYEEWPQIGNMSYPYLRLSKFSYIGENFIEEFHRMDSGLVDSLEELNENAYA